MNSTNQLRADLSVEVRSIEVNVGGTARPAWRISSDGLRKFGQAEVVFTLLKVREAASEVPPGVVKYIEVLQDFAKENRTVREWDVSGYRPPGPFGLNGFVGVVFAPWPASAGPQVCAGALAAIFLTEGELEMGARCSTRRVLHRLGEQARQFPYPHWSDLSRAPTYAVGDSARSALSMFSRTFSPSAYASVSGNKMTVQLSKRTAATAGKVLSETGHVAILPGLSDSAKAALVWRPEAREPTAIALPGSDGRDVAATSLGLVVEPNRATDQVRFTEDGFIALLTPETCRTLLANLERGKVTDIRGGGHEVNIAVR